MKTGWLPKGLVQVERIRCRDYGPVNEHAPAKGVLHTTEGSFESALAVFRQHDAPHFLVGRDKRNRVRVVQLIKLGRTAGALENHAGGVETNSVCRAQIEIVGYSKHTSWLPDADVTDALARLLAELERTAGIPLKHPRVRRSVGKWETASGWLGHADVPENSHWDPGALRWTKLLEQAQTHLIDQAERNEARKRTLRNWILKRINSGWSWSRMKRTHNWHEYLRRGGK